MTYARVSGPISVTAVQVRTVSRAISSQLAVQANQPAARPSRSGKRSQAARSGEQTHDTRAEPILRSMKASRSAG